MRTLCRISELQARQQGEGSEHHRGRRFLLWLLFFFFFFDEAEDEDDDERRRIASSINAETSSWPRRNATAAGVSPDIVA